MASTWNTTQMETIPINKFKLIIKEGREIPVLRDKKQINDDYNNYDENNFCIHL